MQEVIVMDVATSMGNGDGKYEFAYKSIAQTSPRGWAETFSWCTRQTVSVSVLVPVDLELGITFVRFFVFLEQGILFSVHISDILVLFLSLEFLNVHLLYLGLDLPLLRRIWL